MERKIKQRVSERGIPHSGLWPLAVAEHAWREEGGCRQVTEETVERLTNAPYCGIVSQYGIRADPSALVYVAEGLAPSNSDLKAFTLLGQS